MASSEAYEWFDLHNAIEIPARAGNDISKAGQMRPRPE
jgi:hypothetical protein